MIGDLDHLDAPSTTATARRRWRARRCARSWTGCGPRTPTSRCGRASPRSRTPGAGVTVHFERRRRPALRRAGGVDVACVLYPGSPDDAAGPRATA